MKALAFYKRVRALGVEEATALALAEAFDVELRLALEEALEPRRAKDRERKRLRNSADSTEVCGIRPEPLPLAPSPQTPQPHTPTPVEITTRARGGEFERFWAAYPHKVGKGAAEKAFPTALRRADIDAILSGLTRYVRTKPPDRDWCNPATWLSQRRWEDEPAPVPVQLAPRQAHERPHNDQRRTAYAERLGDIDAAMAAAEQRSAGRG